ncbi:thioredoxin family protein [Maribacter aestuarii]|uniref:thioredoxin family protein n=1 Tax=Maribacter aestuarii TaxID=1130723 RepID=UPI00248B7625|nr:thioredoxin family protein [Maribacter aestuarii]
MQRAISNKMHNTTEELIRESLSKGMTYSEYRSLVSSMAYSGKTSGPSETEALINYTRLNDKRMKRWDKTFIIHEEAAQKIRDIDISITWLVLTESWCGDASPALPVMNKIANSSPNITLKILLRDENIELMNKFLTNGKMSIPKLIAIENTTGNVIADWGPRSKNATVLAEDYKAEHGSFTDEFKQDIQVWYNKDKGQSILNDLMELLPLK